MIAGALVLLALISTVFTDVAYKPGGCGGSLQQKYDCVEQRAYLTSNVSMCATLPTSYADQCYGVVAENTKNQTTCSKISDPNVSGECMTYIANATGNPELCR